MAGCICNAEVVNPVRSFVIIFTRPPWSKIEAEALYLPAPLHRRPAPACELSLLNVAATPAGDLAEFAPSSWSLLLVVVTAGPGSAKAMAITDLTGFGHPLTRR